MILFTTLAFGLLVLALLPVVLALRNSRGAERTDQRVNAYRARLAEIEAETRAGVIAAEHGDSARREIELEMLQHVQDGPVRASAIPASSPTTAIIIVLFVGITALCLYLYGGQPELIGVDTSAAAQPDVEAMVTKITAHLEKNPEDKTGWEMLGRAQMALGRYGEAVTTFERLLALTGEDANALVRYADALAMTADGKLGGKPIELINRALALEPKHRTALWLAGMAATERGESAVAVEYWQTLLPLLDDAETKTEVARLIEQAGGTPVVTPEPAATVGITVRVSVAPELAADIPADATVFVTARTASSPAMPLAVVRKTVADLPFEVLLDDSLAMSPQHRLSQHATVDLTARISRSGQAERMSGDWIGELRAVTTATGPALTLVIEQRIP